MQHLDLIVLITWNVISSPVGAATISAVIVSYFSNLQFKRKLAEDDFKRKRIFRNYELYVDKKHTAYIKLWSSLIDAISAVKNQRGLKERLPLEEMNRKDFREQLNKLPLTDKQKQNWLNNFEVFQSSEKEKRNQINKDWFNLLGKVDVFAALPVINQAQRKLILNQVFMNSELDKKIDKSLKLLREVVLIREIPTNTPDLRKRDRELVEENMKEIENSRVEILENMRSELASGDYQVLGS